MEHVNYEGISSFTCADALCESNVAYDSLYSRMSSKYNVEEYLSAYNNSTPSLFELYIDGFNDDNSTRLVSDEFSVETPNENLIFSDNGRSHFA